MGIDPEEHPDEFSEGYDHADEFSKMSSAQAKRYEIRDASMAQA